MTFAKSLTGEKPDPKKKKKIFKYFKDCMQKFMFNIHSSHKEA